MLANTVFFELTVIILVSTVGALLARFFKQPLIPVYILTGLIMGPILHFVQDVETVKLFAEIGIANINEDLPFFIPKHLYTQNPSFWL